MKKTTFILSLFLLAGLGFAAFNLLQNNNRFTEKDFPDTGDDTTAAVVGEQKEDALRNQKKALILSPHQWHFGDGDDTRIAHQLLKSARDYENGITYKVNASKNAGSITIDDYLSLDAYDFIFIGTHGSRVCEVREGEVEIVRGGHSNMCTTVVATGIHFRPEDKQKVQEQMNSRGIQGLAYSEDEIYLKADFFSLNFSNLENKIIIFSACETDQHNSLRNALSGLMSNGQGFLWSNVVYTNDAANAYQHLFDRLINYGETARQAFDEMPSNLKSGLRSFFTAKDEDGNNFDIETHTSLEMVDKGKAMHLIEPVTWLHPKTKEPLQKHEVYPFEGILGDDKNEEAIFAVELLGYTQDELKEMSVTLKVNDKTVTDHLLIIPTEDVEIESGKNEKTTRMIIKGIDLLQDLKRDVKVKLEAKFHLNEESYAYHTLDVKTESSDMRINMQADGQTINMYFDADIDGVKVVYPSENQTIYGDKHGYYYVYSDEEGWMKTKMDYLMGQIAARIPLDLSSITQLPDKGTFLHKIAYFAAEISISKLEKYPGARKISSDQDPKTVFMGEGNVKITFDEKNRLESIQQGSDKISYYYESQEISYPDARVLSLPF